MSSAEIESVIDGYSDGVIDGFGDIKGLANNDIGNKMPFENYKLSINVEVIHKKTNLWAPFAHFKQDFLCQRGQILSLIDMSYEIVKLLG